MREIERYIDALRVNPDGTYTADISEIAGILDVSFAQARRLLREECQRQGYRITDNVIEKRPSIAVKKRPSRLELKAARRQNYIKMALEMNKSGEE